MYSKQQKQDYLKSLRKRWQESKSLADSDASLKQLHEAAFATGAPIQSYYSFAFVAIQMKSQGLSGFPYVDMKTFQGWKENGFKVAKGEHSTADGIVWLSPTYKDADGNEAKDTDYVFPKVYKLFHRSQVVEN